MMEQLDYNCVSLVCRLGMDDAVWSPRRLQESGSVLDGEIAAAFFDAVLIHADAERLLSDEHFTVTARCSRPGRVRKASSRATDPPPGWRGNPTVNFHGHAAPMRASVDDGSRRAPYKKARGREARLGTWAMC